ncbi:MAG: LuxR C-terminal-related transcriptional regulator [Desulfobulbales bacterium]
MAILLCSANETVSKRWRDLLKIKFDLEQADTVAELKDYCVCNKNCELILLHRPLVDIQIFGEIQRGFPTSRFFLLSDRPDVEEGLTFLKQGIVGYANTYISAERLNEAVRIILGGAVWMGQKVMQRLILDSYAKAKEQAVSDSEKKLKTLTNREREIANLVAQGQSNLEIAANLDITERTVKAHLSSIYEKTKTGSRLNLALLINRG